MKEYINIAFVVVGTVLCLAATVRADADKLTVVQAAAIHRLELLQNLSVEAISTSEEEPLSPEMKNAIRAIEAQDGSKTFEAPNGLSTKESMSYANGCIKYDRGLEAGDLREARAQRWPIAQLQVIIRTRERCEQMVMAVNSEAPIGYISDDIAIPDDFELDVALGLRLDGDQSWLTPEGLRTIVIKDATSRQFDVSAAGNKGTTHEWSLDPQNDFVPTEYRVYENGDEIDHVDYSDFRPVGALHMPYRFVWRCFYYDEQNKRHTRETRTVRVLKYQLNDPTNGTSKFAMIWPLGSHVHDSRSGLQFVVKSRARSVSDAELSGILRKKDLTGDARLRDLQRELDLTSDDNGQPPATRP